MENNKKKCLVCNGENCSHHKFNGHYLKKIIILLIIFILVNVIVTNAVRLYGNYTNPQTVTITGTGEINSKPDLSTINFTLRESSKDNNTELLQNNIAKSANHVLAKLKDLGIEDKDIKTSNYQVNPKYDYSNGKSEVSGYEASESIQVKVRNTENVSKILNILAVEKITEVNGPNYEVDDIQNLKDEARTEAIADAKDKAKELAKELGVKIKRIVSYSDDTNANNPVYPIMYRQEMKSVAFDSVSSAGANLPTGEQKVTVNVSLTFQIEN